MSNPGHLNPYAYSREANRQTQLLEVEDDADLAFVEQYLNSYCENGEYCEHSEFDNRRSA